MVRLVAAALPLAAVAIMRHCPDATAEIRPSEETVATEVFVELKTILLSVAEYGETEGLS